MLASLPPDALCCCGCERQEIEDELQVSWRERAEIAEQSYTLILLCSRPRVQSPAEADGTALAAVAPGRRRGRRTAAGLREPGGAVLCSVGVGREGFPRREAPQNP